MKKSVLILCGGRSDEHEISLISTKYILEALDRARFDPLIVGISKQGSWHLEEEKSFYRGEVRADKIRLNTDAPTVTLAPYSKEGRGVIQAGQRQSFFDVVFPILHGPFGEDGTLQGLLEIVDVPYVGSNCGSSWVCMDKHWTKLICKNYGIPTADFVSLTKLEDLEAQRKAIAALGFPVFVKPCRLGSSVGITKVTDAGQLPKAVETALYYDNKCLIEKGIRGREIECAVLGLCDSARASACGEIIPSAKAGWYSYEAKYLLSDGAELVIPAKIPDSEMKRIQDFCLKVYRALECDGMARVDVFYEGENGGIYLNEVNTIPGFTPISMYPKLWQVSGLPYKELITELIRLAFLKQGHTL